MTSPISALMPTHAMLAKLLDHEPPAASDHPSTGSTGSIESLSSLQSLQDRIAAWQTATFPDQLLDGKLAHLVREARELRADPEDTTEWADVLILLLGSAAVRGLTVADLLHVAELKFAVAQQRRWRPEPDGSYHHI